MAAVEPTDTMRVSRRKRAKAPNPTAAVTGDNMRRLSFISLILLVASFTPERQRH
jgi:hypothetical protein